MAVPSRSAVEATRAQVVNTLQQLLPELEDQPHSLGVVARVMAQVWCGHTKHALFDVVRDACPSMLVNCDFLEGVGKDKIRRKQLCEFLAGLYRQQPADALKAIGQLTEGGFLQPLSDFVAIEQGLLDHLPSGEPRERVVCAMASTMDTVEDVCTLAVWVTDSWSKQQRTSLVIKLVTSSWWSDLRGDRKTAIDWFEDVPGIEALLNQAEEPSSDEDEHGNLADFVTYSGQSGSDSDSEGGSDDDGDSDAPRGKAATHGSSSDDEEDDDDDDDDDSDEDSDSKTAPAAKPGAGRARTVNKASVGKAATARASRPARVTRSQARAGSSSKAKEHVVLDSSDDDDDSDAEVVVDSESDSDAPATSSTRRTGRKSPSPAASKNVKGRAKPKLTAPPSKRRRQSSYVVDDVEVAASDSTDSP